ncbi:hypothetical protein BKM31_36010 [[Actinomadura] parvosata subsp. kistnae]|uniref:DUF6286 domain-containing protein n=1 Tax=[Actinomadura] parvosata subsp. kistnae TaxID=1909395 RepID=A0A1V0A7I0_9ACTN|nr:DUF6286 domain-containing protein [Nonomuraea sp. ATCC 55076]AQZ66143.1 hypothetical protein BKM31_36010 [Nonomuraea sp. ATCC 55076]
MTTLQQILPGAVVAPRDTGLRRASRVLRPARTLPGALVALTLTAGLGATAAEVVSALLGAPLGWVPVDEAVALAGRTTWQDTASVALLPVVAGTLMLLLAIVPGRCTLVPVETSDPLIVIGITRSGLRRTLCAAAQQVAGVDKARVRLRRRTIEVTVTTGAESSGQMLRQVGTAVGDRLAGVGTLGTGEVVVRLRRRGA